MSSEMDALRQRAQQWLEEMDEAKAACIVEQVADDDGGCDACSFNAKGAQLIRDLLAALEAQQGETCPFRNAACCEDYSGCRARARGEE
jgi:hypothetical protein